MIHHLDTVLRHLFVAKIAELVDEAQVRFQPPDSDWRQFVSNLTVNGQHVNALNVYLIDVRENRTLRSNERVREINGGVAVDTPAPRRIDCHYLITAWSPATVTPATEPTVDEHALLYSAAAVLLNFQPLVPAEAFAPAPLPAGFPAVIARAELPTEVLPEEGFPKYAEFWGTMGDVHPWRPAVLLVVTLPVVMTTEQAGTIVTTRIAEYRAAGSTNGWARIQIGGTVLDAAGRPLVGAWVRLETPAAVPIETATSDGLGRFTFGGLDAGTYQLRARAVGLGEGTRAVEVPSPTGEYDLTVP